MCRYLLSKCGGVCILPLAFTKSCITTFKLSSPFTMTGKSHLFLSAIPLTMIPGWGRSPNIQVYSRASHLRAIYSIPRYFLPAATTIHSHIYKLPTLPSTLAPPANFSPLSRKPVSELVNICNWQREEDDEKTLVTMDHFMKEQRRRGSFFSVETANLVGKLPKYMAENLYSCFSQDSRFPLSQKSYRKRLAKVDIW